MRPNASEIAELNYLAVQARMLGDDKLLAEIQAMLARR